MNWLKKIIKISVEGIKSILTKNPKGNKPFFSLIGNTFPLKVQLEKMGKPLGRGGLGFNYFQGSWSKRSDLISPEDIKILSENGVDVSPLSPENISSFENAQSQQTNQNNQENIEIGNKSVATEKIKNLKAELEKEIQNSQGNDKIKGMLSFIDKKLEEIANSVDETFKDEFIKAFLKFSAKFYKYSLGNQFLIWAQNPKATYVSGYKQWLEKGRQVKNWDKGISILRPQISVPKSIDTNGMSEEQINKLKRMFFVPAKVYDIADTEVIPNWKDKEGNSAFEPKNITKDTNDKSEEMDLIGNAAIKFGNSLGIKFSDEDLHDGFGGYSAGGNIAINKEYQGIKRLSTVVHELAHELLHWDGIEKPKSREEFKIQRRNFEIDAETTSYIVLSHFGFETKDTPGYLAIYGADSKQVRSRRDNINKAAKLLIDGIYKFINVDVKEEENELA